jgi:two-component system, response regulator PdtaR
MPRPGLLPVRNSTRQVPSNYENARNPSSYLNFYLLPSLIESREAGVAIVLVVEDEILVGEVIQTELEEAGYQVMVAENADAAIAILEVRSDIHLVFTDIDMPGSMDGLKLAACVRDRWPPVHIIITTGKARPSDIPANVLFIRKPYVGRAVVDAIRTFENI